MLPSRYDIEIMYEYYFSKPEAERIAIMKTAHDEVVTKMTKILKKVYKDGKLCIKGSLSCVF